MLNELDELPLVFPEEDAHKLRMFQRVMVGGVIQERGHVEAHLATAERDRQRRAVANEIERTKAQRYQLQSEIDQAERWLDDARTKHGPDDHEARRSTRRATETARRGHGHDGTDDRCRGGRRHAARRIESSEAVAVAVDPGRTSNFLRPSSTARRATRLLLAGRAGNGPPDIARRLQRRQAGAASFISMRWPGGSPTRPARYCGRRVGNRPARRYVMGRRRAPPNGNAR